jgi:hypothetical protein
MTRSGSNAQHSQEPTNPKNERRPPGGTPTRRVGVVVNGGLRPKVGLLACLASLPRLRGGHLPRYQPAATGHEAPQVTGCAARPPQRPRHRRGGGGDHVATGRVGRCRRRTARASGTVPGHRRGPRMNPATIGPTPCSSSSAVPDAVTASLTRRLAVAMSRSRRPTSASSSRVGPLSAAQVFPGLVVRRREHPADGPVLHRQPWQVRGLRRRPVPRSGRLRQHAGAIRRSAGRRAGPSRSGWGRRAGGGLQQAVRRHRGWL